MTWDDYYEKIDDWAVNTAINKISVLEDMGTPDEIVDVLNIIGLENEKGATRLLNRALQYDVKFSGENLSEIIDICTEESFEKVLYQSADRFVTQDLEDLYGCIDDDIIVRMAKEHDLRLPVDLQEEEESEDYSLEIYFAIDAADYALECLANAQHAMNDSSNVSVIDMMTKGFLTSLWKYLSLSEVDAEMRLAQDALQSLNIELRVLKDNKNIQLKHGQLAKVIDMWIDDLFFEALIHLQISKAQKSIRRVITQVENIRYKLINML